MEEAVKTDHCRYVLGSVLNQVLLHQSVIGLEAKLAMEEVDAYPDILIGCAGGGSNLGGLWAHSCRIVLPDGNHRISLRWSLLPVLPSQKGNTVMISVIRERLRRLQKCTRSDATSNRLRRMPADFAITACLRF